MNEAKATLKRGNRKMVDAAGIVHKLTHSRVLAADDRFRDVSRNRPYSSERRPTGLLHTGSPRA